VSAAEEKSTAGSRGLEEAPDLTGLSIVVVDRDPGLRDEMSRALSACGASVRTAGSAGEAEESFSRGGINSLIVDIDLMDEGSEDFIRSFKSANPGGHFYLMIEPDTTVTAHDPSALMVDDYLQKPVDTLHLAHMLVTGTSTALETVDPLVSSARPYFRFRSSAMRRALASLPRIAASGQTVLISGETGTGKEIISRAMHFMSRRSGGPFVALNCSAIPESLIEGELFGHEKGAFTGADRLRRGKFETASNGTLLLDEIGDMPLHLQARLLRVMEEGHIYRIGGERPVPINVRVTASTNRDLNQAVKDGLFREDLFYRLNVLRIHLPPLSERVEDISFLAVYFMERTLGEMGAPQPYPALSSAAISLLEQLPWRGNVRELRNVMTRVATLLPRSARQVLPMHVLPHLEEKPGPGRPVFRGKRASEDGVLIPAGMPLDRAEEILIEAALKHTGGNRTRAARMLGIGIRTLRRKLNKKPA
jgi:DNA-binding NtrC family response regulator